MNGVVLVLALAVTVEALVEYAKSVLRAFLSKEWKTAVTQVAAAGASVMLCLAAGADLYAAAGVNFRLPVLGCVLTGVFASRGANYISDLAKRLTAE